jgi:hypothetical protein
MAEAQASARVVRKWLVEPHREVPANYNFATIVPEKKMNEIMGRWCSLYPQLSVKTDSF